MRRWTLIAAAFAVGLAVTVAGFMRWRRRARVQGLRAARSARPTPAAEELVYGGLALVTVAVLTAVVTTVARRRPAA